ncbi:hypothetical protein EAG_13723, partial [Camponotus floridanus]
TITISQSMNRQFKVRLL